MRKLTRFLDKHRDVGLLIMRVGIGVMFMGHGIPKLMGGPGAWGKLGGALGVFGIHFAPVMWGLMAALSESVGGALLLVGFLARPACFFMLNVMVVATAMHLNKGDSFTIYSHPVEAGIVFLSLIIIGPGKYALDQVIGPFKPR